MKQTKQLTFIEIAVVSLVLVLTIQTPVMAYVGPGAGLAAIGALLAIIAGVFAAIFGFLWYPIKRLMRKRKGSTAGKREQNKQSNSEGEGT